MGAVESSESKVVGALVHLLGKRFGPLSDALSIGLLGSYARSEACALSDLDYYVVFHTEVLESPQFQLDPSTLAAVLNEVEVEVKANLADIPLMNRMSPFWATSEALASGRYDSGRWPAYDRQAFLEGRYRHVAGKSSSSVVVVAPGRELLLLQSAQFLLDVVKPKLDGARFFSRIPQLRPADIIHLGPITITKCVTMPVRLLHTLDKSAEERYAISTEEAVELSRARYHSFSWWPAVDAAMIWRKEGAFSNENVSAAAGLLSLHALSLYDYLLLSYAEETRRLGHFSIAAALEDWRGSLSPALDPLK